MGMFDKPKYLTGEDGYAKPGDTFWLHNARLEGTVNTPQGAKPQAKLLVSGSRDGAQEAVFTSGAGIVGQIQRMDADDRSAFPMEVRLDEIPSGKGNPTRVLTPANLPVPSNSPVGGGSDW